MTYTSSEIKSTVAGYFRYKKQCPIIAFEASDKNRWSSGEPADILVLTQSRFLYEIEVKISLSDLKNDIKKNKHFWFSNSPKDYPINRFYFAVPSEISGDSVNICGTNYPYAGILSVSKFPFNSAELNFGVHELQSAKILNENRLDIEEIIHLIREQSGTLCRLARDKALIESKYNNLSRDNIEIKKFLKLAGVTYSPERSSP